MTNNRRVSLDALKRSLRKPAAPAPLPADLTDDRAAFKAAVAGAKALPDRRHAEIRRPPPPPIPRPKNPDLAEPAEPAKPSNDNPLQLPDAWLHNEPSLAHTPEERLLAQALQGVKPIHVDRAEVDKPKPRPLPLQHERDEQDALAESLYAPTPLELHLEGGDELAYLREGMPRNVLRDLRRGRWVIEDQIDLHGCNREQARDLLAEFMTQCRKRGKRCIRVIHGKGLGSPGREPVLKKLVASWLLHYDDVLAYAQARVHDGGAGALLVLLKARTRG